VRRYLHYVGRRVRHLHATLGPMAGVTVVRDHGGLWMLAGVGAFAAADVLAPHRNWLSWVVGAPFLVMFLLTVSVAVVAQCANDKAAGGANG
jgi:hypothetical protein